MRIFELTERGNKAQSFTVNMRRYRRKGSKWSVLLVVPGVEKAQMLCSTSSLR